MIKRISYFVFSTLFIALIIQLIIPNKAAASIQTETTTTTTFSIRGGDMNDVNDANGKAILKPHQVQGYNVIRLNAALNGRTAELPVGSLLFLYFPTGNSKFSINPDKGIVEEAEGTYYLPKGDIGLLKVVGQGSATITVTTKAGFPKKLKFAEETNDHWSGYQRTGSDGSFTDITSTWTVPTASSCSSGDTISGEWVGIDGVNGTDGADNLIQTGTASACA